MTVSDTPPFDKSRLRMAADTKEEEEALLALFLAGAEDKLNGMRWAMITGAWSDWQRAAHYLKGSGDNLGMTGFVEACRKAELSEPLPVAEAGILLEDIMEQLQCIKDYIGRA